VWRVDRCVNAACQRLGHLVPHSPLCCEHCGLSGAVQLWVLSPPSHLPGAVCLLPCPSFICALPCTRLGRRTLSVSSSPLFRCRAGNLGTGTSNPSCTRSGGWQCINRGGIVNSRDGNSGKCLFSAGIAMEYGVMREVCALGLLGEGYWGAR